jgi:hypothetical protein
VTSVTYYLEPWQVLLLMYYRTMQMVKIQRQCNDKPVSRDDEATRVQLTVLRPWNFADCPIWVLAKVLLHSETFVLPSEEEGCDVYCTCCLRQCCGHLTAILARHLTEERSGHGSFAHRRSVTTPERSDCCLHPYNWQYSNSPVLHYPRNDLSYFT